VDVHGVPVDCLSMDEVVGKIRTYLSEDKPRFLATADTSGVVIAQEDPGLMAAYHQASIVTPDSLGVTWALRRRGIRQERVTGVDLVERLFFLSAETGARIFILGSGPGVADEAARKLCTRIPGAVVAGTRDGYFKPQEEETVIAEVARAKPDILFVSMGIPRQEKLILAHHAVIGAKVSVGVGGSFDVYSGRVKRAPSLVQKMKLEWLWRILSDPKKAKKAGTLPKFALMELMDRP
jgi:N-acetylglucosaminyldiphosphoundecaprenol N-acetyl-beta-D-mannosaminyltransferase